MIMQRYLYTVLVYAFAVFTPYVVYAQGEPKTVTLTAVPGLQFDQVRFSVKANEKIRLVLKNGDDMSHNLVITAINAREKVVDGAMKLAEKGPELNYVPASKDVLWSIPVIAPGEESFIEFTAPDKPGVYPYVCTFPGHGFYMYGAMYVDAEVPPLETDPNIPPLRRKGDESGGHAHHAGMAGPHPYALKPPYLYRAYMEDSGPASIAVHLPGRLSYCWDAAVCDLRYAWEGDFVDNSGLWKGKPNAVARVLGTVFYRNASVRSLRIGNAGNEISFKGYRMVDRYPEFHYTVDGIDVFERIHAIEGGRGVERIFRIPNADKPITFSAAPYKGVSYGSSAGSFAGNRIVISPEQAKHFVITIRKQS